LGGSLSKHIRVYKKLGDESSYKWAFRQIHIVQSNDIGKDKWSCFKWRVDLSENYSLEIAWLPTNIFR
jgi:hypothetical protein